MLWRVFFTHFLKILTPRVLPIPDLDRVCDFRTQKFATRSNTNTYALENFQKNSKTAISVHFSLFFKSFLLHFHSAFPSWTVFFREIVFMKIFVKLNSKIIKNDTYYRKCYIPKISSNL